MYIDYPCDYEASIVRDISITLALNFSWVTCRFRNGEYEDTFFAGRGAARASRNGAILGIYKQIWESYITVIVPSPRADEDRRIRELCTMNDKGERKKKRQRERERERKNRRDRRMLTSMSPFELIGIWINPPARPSKGIVWRESAKQWLKELVRINKDDFTEKYFVFIEKLLCLT